MAQSTRVVLTKAEKTELWRRWRQGESMGGIGIALNRARNCIAGRLRQHVGFTPPLRKPSEKALTLDEREEISRGLSAGHWMRQIARGLNRWPPTISREKSIGVRT